MSLWRLPAPRGTRVIDVMSDRKHVPELLAPAGDWECAKAAIENGADAIYFGLDRFNARMRAHNFTAADLPALMEYLHRRGAKGYLGLNTLVFADEMRDAEELLRTVIAAGVDAVIVQDVGLCRLIRQLSPDFPIHASTQMTVSSAAGVEFARKLGCSLVVLARECSVADIEKIQASQTATMGEVGGRPALPLEIFVHGALCVAYSGQCLTSESLGGRSANRGECAQACRLPYELIADGKPVPLGDRRYLLSPQDLAGLELLPQIVKAGVASLKIEGRLKSAEYVANITQVYRKAIDRLAAPSGLLAEGQEGTVSAKDRYHLEMAFSRGLHTGWLEGVNNQKLVHGRFGKKRGVLLGRVQRIQGERVVMELEAAVKPGDGVVFDHGKPDEDEEGGRVYTVDFQPRPSVPDSGPSPGRPRVALLGFGQGDINLTRVHVGDRLWKTNDPELDRQLRQTYEGDQIRYQRPVHMEIQGEAGGPLTLVVRDELGRIVRGESQPPLVVATNQPLTTDRLQSQFGRLGGTPFRLERLENRLQGPVILPVSELNRLRREVIAQLEALRAKPLRWKLNPAPGRLKCPDPTTTSTTPVTLIPLVRTLGQLDAVLALALPVVYCELEDPKKYREATARVREARPQAPDSCRTQLFVAPPRITRPGEDWMLKQVRSAEADGYLVRNYDHLSFFRGCRCVADFSYNIANALAAEFFIRECGVERVTASYDLNSAQLEALLVSAPPSWFELTIHQHMPMFHMEHCVFCAFLCSGTDYTNCGRPCDRHELKLRDRVGAEHPVKADAGCRNTVYNSRAQTGAEYVHRFMELGVRHLRLEFVQETAEEVLQTIDRYQRLIRGQLKGHELWRELKLHNQLGVTRGPLDRGQRPLTVLP